MDNAKLTPHMAGSEPQPDREPTIGELIEEIERQQIFLKNMGMNLDYKLTGYDSIEETEGREPIGYKTRLSCIAYRNNEIIQLFEKSLKIL